MTDELLAHVELDSCTFQVFVVWPDGQQTTYEGVRLTAEDVAAQLEGIAAGIRAELASGAQDAPERAS